MSGWAYVEDDREPFVKGARLVATYTDGRPDEAFIVDDVRESNGVMTLDVHLEGLDDSREFLWYSADDESPAQPSEED